MTRPRGRAPLLRALAPVPGTPSQASILRELRRVILDGGAPPGSPIPLDEVAEQFRVSAIPVREALRTLIGEGLVDQRPRQGYQVARLTRAEFVELYLVRAALEAAALRGSVAAATPADDDAAAGSQRLQRRAVAAGDAATYHRESRAFHLALLRPCRMHRLLHMFESAWNVTEPAQLMTQVPVGHLDRLLHDHDAMLAAFSARDVEALLAASALHHEHLRDAVLALPDDAGAFAVPPPTPLR